MNSALPQPEIAVEWAPPRFESVNPQQDVTADLMEVRAGFSTPAHQIEAARREYDDWWQALGWVRYGLIAGGMLREVEVTAAMPKARPWERSQPSRC